MGMKKTTHLHLVPNLRMGGSKPPVSLCLYDVHRDNVTCTLQSRQYIAPPSLSVRIATHLQKKAFLVFKRNIFVVVGILVVTNSMEQNPP